MESADQIKNQDQGKSAVVIYHKNCVDGFGAAWAFHRLKEQDYPGGVTYIPAQYGDIPGETFSIPDEPEDLYILDLSFNEDILCSLCSLFNKVVLLDHHKTAQESLSKLQAEEFKPINLEIVFDMNRSGAGITWDYLIPKYSYPADARGQRPKLINYIEDRDLWKFDLDFSKEISALIRAQLFTFDRYDWLADVIRSERTRVIELGTNLIQQESLHHESIINECTRKIVIAGESGLVCNCPGFFASEVGNILAIRSSTYGATYYHDSKDSVKFSLRSTGDYDVSRLAKIFGGGGHKNAAGFILTNPNTYNQDEGIILWSGETISQSKGLIKTVQDDS